MHTVLIAALAAFIPLLVGSAYYGQKAFSNLWMKEASLTAEDLKKGSMPLIFGLCYLFSFFLSFGLSFIVIHQSGVNSIFAALNDDASQIYLADFMAKYGTLYRTFKHGALHGFIASVTLALPIISITSLFERKSGKYIALHWGFYAICLTLMGGIICQWA